MPEHERNETPTCYSSGSVTYSGTLDTTHGNTWYWTITSTGRSPSQACQGGTQAHPQVGITGNNGTNGSSWTRFYQGTQTPGACLTLDATACRRTSVPGRHLPHQRRKITGAKTNINAGGNIYIDNPPE